MILAICRAFFIETRNGHYWPIPYRNLGAPPISLWEQREAMKRLRTEGRRLVDERLIFAMLAALTRMPADARRVCRLCDEDVCRPSGWPVEIKAKGFN